MTSVFVYEFVSGGGMLGKADDESLRALAVEGAAMLRALVEDFAAIPGTRVSWLRDARLPLELAGEGHVVASAAEHAEAFGARAGRADWTVVIAPEIDGHLLERCQAVLAADGRLLGPGPEFVALASDKHATAEWLLAASVPAPRGRAIAAGEPLPEDFSYPAVWKPLDGAGSTGVVLVQRWTQGAGSGEQGEGGWGRAKRAPSGSGKPPSLLHSQLPAPSTQVVPGRLEAFCPGLPVSVAFLTGPTGVWPLAPCAQRLSNDGQFTYLGGRLPLEPALAERAIALGRRALAALPPAIGYVGLDLVLGEDPSGRQDVVIEVNPRLTMSYVGLRAAAESNLAQAMLEAAEGRPPDVRWSRRTVAFDSVGTTTCKAS
jgi:predicted ATP-grasp superfamily ATP-dependent carboligase